MPPSRDSFRRNRVAPVDASILPLFAVATRFRVGDGLDGLNGAPENRKFTFTLYYHVWYSSSCYRKLSRAKTLLPSSFPFVR
jgi:hypothetical protein